MLRKKEVRRSHNSSLALINCNLMTLRSLIRGMRHLQGERGSASAEFVLWVIPLFLPLIILIGQVSEISTSKIETLQLARTALRAFVSAPDTSTGHLRIKQVLALGGSGENAYRVSCKMTPCIQPNNFVRLTLSAKSPGVRVVVATGTGRWVQGESGSTPSNVNMKQGAEMEAIENSLDWLDSVREVVGIFGTSG
jgi:hypothetical protein